MNHKILFYLILLISCQRKDQLIEKRQKAMNLQVEHIDRHEGEYRYTLQPAQPASPPKYPWTLK